jgi:hypothetical protein
MMFVGMICEGVCYEELKWSKSLCHFCETLEGSEVS